MSDKQLLRPPTSAAWNITRAKAAVTALLLFVVLFLGYNNSPNMFLTDSRWALHVGFSLLREGNVNLDEYHDQITSQNYYVITEHNGHMYCYMPVTPYVLATPVLAVLQHFSESIWGYDLAEAIQRKPHYSASAQKLIASLIVAATAVCIFYIALCASGSWQLAVTATLLFACGTSAWSVASRVFWHHGPSMLALAATLLILERGRHDDRLTPYAALPLALAYVIRPTNCASVLVLSLYVLLRHPRRFVAFGLWSLPVALPFFAYSLVVFQQLLPPYFSAGRLTFPDTMAEGLAGNLVSPARGLLVYSPFFLFCLHAAWLRIREKTLSGLDVSLWIIIALHTVIIASFTDWYGGHGYGPRYLSDMLPFLMYLLLPSLRKILEGLRTRECKNMVLAAVFLLLAGWSVFVHCRGATAAATWKWNTLPVNINQAHERLWDWRRPQFLASENTPVPDHAKNEE